MGGLGGSAPQHYVTRSRAKSRSDEQEESIELRGQGRGRTADLPLFRRTLVPTELPGREGPVDDDRTFVCDPDGTRTRDLRRDRATR